MYTCPACVHTAYEDTQALNRMQCMRRGGGRGIEEAAGEICIFMLTYIYVGGGIFLSLPPSILSCPAFIYVS
jgi:hypothetical protein